MNKCMKIFLCLLMVASYVPVWDIPAANAAALPAGWSNADLGSPSSAGSAAYNESNGTFTLTGTGNGIAATSTQQYQYAYTSLSGSFTMIARIASLSAESGTPQAGIMIRKKADSISDTYTTSYMAGLMGSANHLYYSQRKTDTGTAGNSTFTDANIYNAPLFMKVSRQLDSESSPTQSTIYLYYGTLGEDGETITWTQVKGDKQTGILSDVYAGLAVGGKGAATFDYVTIIDSYDTSSTSSLSSLTRTQPVAPGAPTGLTVTVDDGQVSLEWESVTEATYYNVKRSAVTGGPYDTVASEQEDNSFTDTDVANGSTYYYVVTSIDSDAESVNSSEVSVTPADHEAPDAPAHLLATPGDTAVQLIWNAMDDGVTYNVKRSTVSGGGYSMIATNVTAASYLDSGLTNDTIYYYVVTAVNETVESASSAEAAAAPAAILVSDDFDDASYSPGQVVNGTLAGYTVATTVTDTYAQIKSQDGPNWIDNTDNKAMYLQDQSNSKGIKIAKTFDKQENKVIVAEVDFKQETAIDATLPNNTKIMRLLDSKASSIITDIETTNGTNGRNIYYRVGSTYNAIIPAGEYVAGKWYHIKVEVDLSYTLKGATITVTDGSQTWKLEGQTFYQTGTVNIGAVDAATSDGNPGYFYLDNLNVYEAKTAPSSFTAAAAYAGNIRVNLAWERVPGADSYTILRSAAPGSGYETIASGITADSAATSRLSYLDTNNDSGLENETTYYYIIKAVNEYGEIPSEELSATPLATIVPPATPANVRAEVRDSMVTLKWDAVSDALSYIIKRSTSKDGTYTGLNPDKSITDTSYRDTALTNETTYYYKISSMSAGGESEESDPLLVIPTSALAAPASLKAVADNGRIELSWSSVTAAASYTVKRSTVNGGPYNVIDDAESVTGTGFTDTTAVNGTTYYYVVVAVNSKAESMISAQVKATPYAAVDGVPSIPSGLMAVADEGKVTLSWNAVSHAVFYSVKRKASTDSSYSAIAADLSGTFYEDANVVNGTTYSYVITASNDSGESTNSDNIAAVPAEVITVDPSGGGDFTAIQAAVDSIGSTNTTRKVIYIKNGIYREKITVAVPYISFVGESRDGTVIVYGDYAGPSGNGILADGSQIPGISSTFSTPTVAVTKDFFTADNLTIENDAGPRDIVGTAVALSVKSDQSVFENVKLLGYQDTLYNGSGRQYFRNSIIAGDVDFIFGEATAVVIEDSDIISREHPDSANTSGGYVTAAAQTNANDPGYVFMDSRLIQDDTASGSHYLGRPWKNNPKVRFINTSIDSHIAAAGWKSWNVAPNIYSEYNSYGSGANAKARDTSLSTQMTGEEASALTIPVIFSGWDASQTVIQPKVTYTPSIDQSSVLFDKNGMADLEVEIDLAGDMLTSITNNGAALELASDYTYNGSSCIISQSYLSSLDYGSTELQFHFAAAVPLSFEVKVIDTTMVEAVESDEDGWASYGGGVSGGINASADNIFVVSNRSELVKALGGDSAKTNSTPKIIFLKGAIDMNVDDGNNPLGYEDYRDSNYSLENYLTAYDPSVWGMETVPSGTLETARRASQLNQAARMKVNVGSNTTIVGLGTDAKIIGGNLNLDSVSNIIIRNIEFQNAYDYFPQWDPTDGSSGNWNSQYDNITIKTATRVWTDHNSFNDNTGDRFADGTEGDIFGRHYQHHDGFIDITNNADLITLSYNHFANHDKTMLIGSSDSAPDNGYLRTTIHHNYFENIVQRVPRIRFGQVHIYNNYYNSSSDWNSLYSIGVGASSQIYSELNYFENVRVPVAYYDSASAGAIQDAGSYFDNSGIPTWKEGVTWSPGSKYSYTADAAGQVKAIVLENAGAAGRAVSATESEDAESLGLTATASDVEVKLTWDTVQSAVSYQVKRSTASGGPYETIRTVTAADTDAEAPEASYTDTDVLNGSVYYYVVTAVASSGEFVSWNEASVTVGESVPAAVPEAPSGLKATAGDKEVVLEWTYGTDAVSYRVKRSVVSGGPYQAIADGLTEAGFTDTDVTNDVAYYYVVTASNSAGESGASAEVIAEPYSASDGDDDGDGDGDNDSGSSGGGTGTTTDYDTADDTESPTISVTPSVETIGGKKTARAAVEAMDLQQALAILTKEGNTAERRISIDVPTTEPVAQVQLPAKALSDILSGAPETVLSIHIGDLTYDLPVMIVDAAALSDLLGAKMEDVTITIAIEHLEGEAAKAIEAKAAEKGWKLLSGGIDFTITAEANGRFVTLNDFGSTYVTRVIVVTGELNPSQSTVVHYDPAAGEIAFVPATLTVSGGVTRITIKRPGNSIYMVLESNKSFSDLFGHWAQDDVELLASKLVVKGMTDTSFGPQEAITRAQFAALLVRALGLEEGGVLEGLYSDVEAGDWFAGAVNAAAQAGLVNGLEDGTFRPNDRITREQMAVMISRAFGLAGKKADADANSLKMFADSGAISSWAAAAVAQAVNAGIVNGSGDNAFHPGDNATRAEAAVMIKRLLQYIEFMN